MVMADRPDVKTAPVAIAAIDLLGLGESMAGAFLRVPFRQPWRGAGGLARNLTISVTRELTRSFMGYAMSLPIDEFRSLEKVLDRISETVLPPWVAAEHVTVRRDTIAGVPGLWFRPAATSTRARRCCTSTAAATSARRRTCTRCSRRGSPGRPAARSSSPTTGSRPSSRTPPRCTTRSMCSPRSTARRTRHRVPPPRSSWPATRAGAGWPAASCTSAGAAGSPSRPACCSSRPRSACSSTSRRSPTTRRTTCCRGTSRRTRTCTASTHATWRCPAPTCTSGRRRSSPTAATRSSATRSATWWNACASPVSTRTRTSSPGCSTSTRCSPRGPRRAGRRTRTRGRFVAQVGATATRDSGRGNRVVAWSTPGSRHDDATSTSSSVHVSVPKICGGRRHVRGRQPVVRVPHEQAEVRRGSQAGTRRSPRSARRRCWSASSGDPNNSPRSPSKASARTSTAAATPSSASSATTWWSPPTCSPTGTPSSRSSSSTGTRPDAPGSRCRCSRSSTTAGPRSFPADRMGEYRFRIVAWPDELATWRRDFAKKLAAGVDTDLDREEGALLAEQQRQAGDRHATAPRSRRGSSACAAASTGRPRRASTDW